MLIAFCSKTQRQQLLNVDAIIILFTESFYHLARLLTMLKQTKRLLACASLPCPTRRLSRYFRTVHGF
jgi:hypothetical protein